MTYPALPWPPKTFHAVLKRLFLSSLIAALASLSAGAQNPASAPAATGFATIKGVVADSLHESALVGALVRVENTTREGITDALGR